MATSSSAGDARFERADTGDLPRPAAHDVPRPSRATGRPRPGRTRPDLPDGCPESFDWHFYKWIWNFGRDDRPRILDRLEETDADVVHLRSPADVERYVESL